MLIFKSRAPFLILLLNLRWATTLSWMLNTIQRTPLSSHRLRFIKITAHGLPVKGENFSCNDRVHVIYDEFHVHHIARFDHAETPERVLAAKTLLCNVEGIKIKHLNLVDSDKIVASDAFDKVKRALNRVHQDWYIDDIIELCNRGGGKIDYDTYVTKDTYEVCMRATSAWLDGCDSAVNGIPAFALTRPPGHHATSCQAMGFCIFNHAAAAAKYALDELGLERVSILDFDVHFGNGVAAIIRSDPRIRYCSLHETGSFPGTGLEEMSGGPNKNIRSLEIDPDKSTWEAQYKYRFENEAIPWLAEQNPQLLIVCAGYDALEVDPLANFSLQPEDYFEMSLILKEKFGRNILFGLEGGYAPDETAQAILSTLKPFIK